MSRHWFLRAGRGGEGRRAMQARKAKGLICERRWQRLCLKLFGSAFSIEKTSGLNLRGLGENHLFAVSYKNVVGENGNILVKSIEDIRRRFKLPDKSRVALIRNNAGFALRENLATLRLQKGLGAHC